MRKRINLLGLSLAVVTVLSFSGCGDNDSDDSSTSSGSLETGTFVDAPVQGLHYITATQDAYTDENGNFKYKSGETVEFKLGTLSLGTVNASSTVTPYTLGDSNTSAPSKKTQNIALLLQNFDANRSNNNRIDLSKLQDYDFTNSDVNLSAETATIESSITTLFANNDFKMKIDDTNTTLIDTSKATENMHNYIKSVTVSKEDGFSYKWLSGKTLWDIHYSEHHSGYKLQKLVFGEYDINKLAREPLTIIEGDETLQATYNVRYDGFRNNLIITDEHGDDLYNIRKVEDNKLIIMKDWDHDNEAYLVFTEAEATKIFNTKK